MVLLIRLVRIAFLLLLAVIAVSLIIATGQAQSGALEKLVLVAAGAACVAVGYGVSSLAARLQERAVRR